MRNRRMIFEGIHDYTVYDDRSEFLVAIDPGHFVGTVNRRTPEMPDLKPDDSGDLVPDWGSVGSKLWVNREKPGEDGTAPPTVTTPEGVCNVFTYAGIATPSGWNVSDTRKNPAYGVLAGVPETERIQMREWEFNNAVAKHLIGLLKERGYSVLNVAPENDPKMRGIGIDNDDNGVGNTRRASRANNKGHDAATFNTFGKKADYYLSIHANAFPTNPLNRFSQPNGTETYYQSELIDAEDNPPSRSKYEDYDRSKFYADIIQRNLCANGYGQKNRTVKRPLGRWTVLFDVEMPASLAEVGFFTNFTDALLLMDDAYRIRTAECLANAVNEIYQHWKENQT